MDGITNTTSSISTPISQAGSQGGILEQDDFLKIMIAEISNQDPFEPLDNREFLGQLTQMQNLEASTTMTTTLAELTESLGALNFGQQLASAGSLIGQRVTGFDTLGNEVIGLVNRFQVEDGQAVLGLVGVSGFGSQEDDTNVPVGTSMRLDHVSEVRGILIELGQEEPPAEPEVPVSDPDPLDSGGTNGPGASDGDGDGGNNDGNNDDNNSNGG